jgi:hypothetical protein
MNIPVKLLKMIPTAAVGAAAFTLTTQTAPAFFPPIPTGGGPVSVGPQQPPPIILPISPGIPVPPVVPPPVVPPVPPPPFVPPPVPPVVNPGGKPDCGGPHTPQATPEPATIVSGVIGLSVLGGYAWRRRKGDRAGQ